MIVRAVAWDELVSEVEITGPEAERVEQLVELMQDEGTEWIYVGSLAACWITTRWSIYPQGWLIGSGDYVHDTSAAARVIVYYSMVGI